MSKKVKCIDCHNSSHWALPYGVSEQDYEYAKLCFQTSKASIVCNETMKTKSIKHEQYCKKFLKKTEMDLEHGSYHQKELLELEKMIKEYEESRDIEN